MTSPFEKMLDDLEWEPLHGECIESDLPVATHVGILKLGECEFRVYQLSDGNRVIDAEDMEAFFGNE